MSYLWFGLGVAIFLMLFIDIYVTVFVPRGGGGPISSRLYKHSWSIWKRLGGRLSGTRRRWWLAQLGPMLVPLTLMVWGVMLVGAFALIYAPWVSGFSISPEKSGPMSGWAMALYYSGYSAVTLGVGDIVPDGTAPRFLAVFEAGLGFALFTASVSYLLSVYGARDRSTAAALMMSRLVGRREGGNPVGLLIGVSKAGSESELINMLEHLSLSMSELLEAVGEYPLIQYFHEPNDDRAISVALSDLLMLTTICRSMLDPQQYPRLAEGPSVRASRRLAIQFIDEWMGGTRDETEEDDRSRREHYEAMRRRLIAGGVALRGDDEAWKRFCDLSSEWDVASERMRAELGYRAPRIAYDDDDVPPNT